MNPKVSILIPIYNVSAYIEKCAHSLFKQTFSDIEYVFVNDATPDDSIEKLINVINLYPDRKNQVKIIQHPVNKGLAVARNSAIDASSGDYIAVVDSDDYIDPEMIEILYLKAVSENADIVVSDMMMEYSNHTNYVIDYVSDNENEHFKDIIRNEQSHSFLCDKLVLRHLYELPECRVPDGLNYYEDRHVATRLFYFAKKTVKINRAFYHYVHYNTNAITKSKDRMHFENVIEFWTLLDSFLIEHGEFDKYKDIINISKVRSKIVLMFDTNSSKLRKEFGTMFIGEQLKCNEYLKTGEKLMLFFVNNKLYFLAQLYHNLLLIKNKYHFYTK
jgi:glycosyltransferase involved in cell wall biosynthesis